MGKAKRTEKTGTQHPSPLSIQVMEAARGVAELSPTPTPLRIARVAKLPVMDEQKACKEVGDRQKVEGERVDIKKD